MIDMKSLEIEIASKDGLAKEILTGNLKILFGIIDNLNKENESLKNELETLKKENTTKKEVINEQ